MKDEPDVYVLPPEIAIRQLVGLVRRGLAAAVLLSACACAAPPAEAPRRLTLLPDVGARPRLVAVSANSARRAALEIFTRPIAGRRTYTVKAGDTLTRIAVAQLGEMGRWKEIWDLNRDRVANENLIYPRLVLLMP
jgi:nucleoid-associated protein YgaU